MQPGAADLENLGCSPEAPEPSRREVPLRSSGGGKEVIDPASLPGEFLRGQDKLITPALHKRGWDEMLQHPEEGAYEGPRNCDAAS